ncbi:unnamed protein product [Plutella xylostella]|uniref:(diamondback moth) hypothetical protein n=1 Tax=Plutella xylostella TaxID=51655 RepID=A0A8S4DQH8_PLUXY|nr:unnamed protein product [Plutella xylostella]
MLGLADENDLCLPENMVPGRILCSVCSRHFDFPCSGITEAGYRKLGDRKASWRCPSCKAGSSPQVTPKVSAPNVEQLYKELQLITKKLAPLTTLVEDVKTIRSDIDGLMASVENAHASIKDFNDSVNVLSSRLKLVEERMEIIPDLEKKLSDLQEETNQREQWLRANNLEIKGVPQKQGENLLDIVVKIGNELNYPVTKTSINYVARVPSRDTSTPKPIIVSFINRYMKEDFIAAARSLNKPLTPENINLHGTMRIYINDHLTVANKQLLLKTKEAARDFNMSDITWLSSANDFLIPSGLSGDHVYNFIDTLSLCNLNQYNNILNNFGRLLDLVLSNKNVSVKECLDPLVPEDPHHKALLIDIALSTTTPLPINPHTLYSYSRADYTNIKKSVREINWHDKLSSHDLNTAVDLFYSTLYSIRDKYVPTRRAGNESYPPWFNSALVKILKEKHKYYKKFKTYGNISDELSFKTLRDRAKKVENECYANYIRSIESAIVQNPKAFWSYVKSKREGSSVPSSVSYAGVTSDTGPGISELFSSYFHSTFIQNNTSNNNPYPSDILSVCDISSIEVRTGEIERFLKSLDLSKSAGPDEMPAVFLSNCASELTVPIAILFSRSLTEGVVPLRWKLAFISPIHKKGSKDQVGNYRPISKLCLIAKVLERIVFNQLYNRLKSAFSPAQHGFLKGRSTVSNLVIFNDFITEEMDSNNNQVATIYTDYSKAFDRIDHYLLLQKLHIIGVRGHLLDWFRSYLNNRKQAVVLNGFTSSWRSIPSGVPQGSLLGPLLFIIFINDIDTCFINSNYLLFADDMKIFRKVDNSLDEALLQDDLQRLDQYCTNNSLDLNVDKCYFIVFTRKRKPFMCSFKIKNQPLNQVYSTKDLGFKIIIRFAY